MRTHSNKLLVQVAAAYAWDGCGGTLGTVVAQPAGMTAVAARAVLIFSGWAALAARLPVLVSEGANATTLRLGSAAKAEIPNWAAHT